MKANVTYEGDTPSSFVVTGDRTRWYFNIPGNGVAVFTRVEVENDEHSTETATVLFGGEWKDCMEYVKTLPFLHDLQIQESLD